ncbi:Putative F-box/LRR-repeat protein At3g18150 [Linum grandiflorum]
MEEQPNNLTATAGEDLISGLPDEILHCIIGRLELCEEAGQTISLSRRWRRVWHSYPVVHYNNPDVWDSRYRPIDLEEFGDSAMERFSRDKLLGMESLKLEPSLYGGGERYIRSPVVERLIDLGLERKAEHVQILAVMDECLSGLELPNLLLFNSIIKSLRLSNVYIPFDRYFGSDSSTSLRSLYLGFVEFETNNLLGNLIAKSPLLETLEIIRWRESCTLQVSKHTNLKTLEMSECLMEEIEIVAPQLESLYLRDANFVRDFKLQVTAPLLNRFEISGFQLTEGDLQAMLSKFPYLQYLKVGMYHKLVEKKLLKFSSSSLVELELEAPCGLEELELDVGPGFEKFFLHYQWWPLNGGDYFTHKLQKLEISNAGASCRLHVSYEFHISRTRDELHQWLVGFKKFIRSIHVHTVIIDLYDCWDDNIDDEEADHRIYRGTIEYLKLKKVFSSFEKVAAFLDFFLWACQPKIITIPYLFQCYKFDRYDFNWDEFFTLKEFHGPTNWRRQLKDKKIEERKNQIYCSLTWDEF